MRDQKVRIEGKCKFGPQVLGIMDSIILSVRYALFNVRCHVTDYSYLVTLWEVLDKLITK